MSEQHLNCALDVRSLVVTADMPWTRSPGGQVLRKRVHLCGPPEAGQVTSVVRYEPGAQFPPHPHPDGEEILVLEGVFSDEQGHWPAGTYLLNPEGFHHSPYSKDGCTLLVKLRQYPGPTRAQLALDSNAVVWDGDERLLYQQDGFTDTSSIQRFPSGEIALAFPEGGEVFVLQGSATWEGEPLPRYSWARLPAGDQLTGTCSSDCQLYIKRGGFTYLLQN